MNLSKKKELVLYAVIAAAFLLLNRAAYSGYFQDDDINSMQWTRWGSTYEYLKGVLTPVYAESYRAVGFYYFHLTERAFGLEFPKYVAVLHAIHLLNVGMLWLLMRRLGASPAGAAAGCAFFALQAAFFDTVWKPAFVFDLLCGTFCTASLLLWDRGRWILSVVFFWLAYKAKELAVMLPAVLVCYELWFGKRRWVRLIPCAAASLAMVLQAVVLHPDQAPDYVLHFTAGSLAVTLPFYAREVFLFRYSGFLLPVAAAAAPNRRTLFGLSAFALFLFPLLWLPARVLGAYCYVPFAGLAIAIAGMIERVKPQAATALFVLWLALDIRAIAARRKQTLREDADARACFIALQRFSVSHPVPPQFVYEHVPAGFHPWGLDAGVMYFYKLHEVSIPPAGSPEGEQQLKSGAVILSWNEAQRRLDIQGR